VRTRKLAYVPYIPTLEEHSEPARYITGPDADAIAARLPGYLITLFRLALLLAIRRGQLSRTLRRYVDLDRGVIAWPPAECKFKSAHTVPLDPDALVLVETAMADARLWCPYLLHGPRCAPGSKPSKKYGCIGDTKKALKSAVLAAGLPFGRKNGGIVFHCTRSTAATDLRAGGMDESDVMAVGGWKTRSVFETYNLGDVEKLRERLATSRARRGTVVPLRRASVKNGQPLPDLCPNLLQQGFPAVSRLSASAWQIPRQDGGFWSVEWSSRVRALHGLHGPFVL
jgi:integrase